MLDMDTDSDWESSTKGYNYRVYDGNGAQLADLSNWISGANSRQPRLGTALVNGGKAPLAYWQSYAVLRMWVERTHQYLVKPEANIYGIVLLYKEYHIDVAQPDYMSFRSGELKSDGSPVMEQRRPAKMTTVNDVRHVGQPIQMIEAPAEGNEAIYGELIGYNIKPLNGKEFFYATNSTTIYLTDEMIRLIDANTTEMQNTNRTVDGGGAL